MWVRFYPNTSYKIKYSLKPIHKYISNIKIISVENLHTTVTVLGAVTTSKLLLK